MKNFAKRISALVLAVVVSAAVLCPAAFAAQLPSLPKGECVVDDAGVLSSGTVQTITELNAQLESSCSGAQISVLTVEYTGNDSTEDYATGFQRMGHRFLLPEQRRSNPAGDGVGAVCGR